MEENTQRVTEESQIPVPTELQGKDLGTLPKPIVDKSSAGVVSAVMGQENQYGLDILDKYAKHVHSYIREHITVADKKASFVFTIAAALLVYLYEKGIVASWIKIPSAWNLGQLLTFLAVGGLFLSCIFAVSVVFPRLHGSKRGFVFWESIADFESPSHYVEAAEELNSEQIIQEILKHGYELARVCRAKYRLLNWAIRIGTVGAISAMLYLLKGG